MLNLSLRYVNLVMLLNSLDAVAAILYLLIDKLTYLLPPRYYLKTTSLLIIYYDLHQY